MAVHHSIFSNFRMLLQRVRPLYPYLLLFIFLESVGVILFSTRFLDSVSMRIGVLTVFIVLGIVFLFQVNRNKTMLTRSAERLQHITDSLGEGLLVINAYKMISFVNPAAERLLGYAPHELTGKTVHTVFRNHTEDCSICNAVDRGLKYYSDDQVASTKTQTLLPVELTIAPLVGKDNTVTDAVVVFRDITRRKQAQEALEEEHNLLRILIDTITDPIYIKDPGGHYLMLNTAFINLLGSPGDSEADWIGKTAFDLLAREEAEEIARLDRLVMKTGRPLLAQEVFFQHIGESGIWVSRSSAPMRHSSGEIFGILGINRDITRQKQAEIKLVDANRQLRENNAQLATLNANKDKFFSIISHDLRSPFNTLLGFTYLLNERLDTYNREEIREKALKLHTAAENIYALLENLLTWSRMQRDAMQCEPEELNVWELVNENVMIFEPKAVQKGIRLLNTVPRHVIAYADYSMANTIVRNLVSNALKFTEAGGQITISASLSEADARVSISDTGKGIDDDGLSKIFRLDAHYTRSGTAGEPGTGLGLNLCKEMVEKQGGTIAVESLVGQGTTFHFTLPAAQKNA